MQSISVLPSSINSRRLFEYRKILQSSPPMSPLMEESPASSTFNIVTLIPLILFIVLVSGNLVYLYIVCSRRWRGLPEPESVASVEEVNGDTSKKMDIKALPTTVYDTGSPVAGIDCPICLAEFIDGEKVRVLPECCHSFHLDCIDAWLASNPSCPSCRHSLLSMAAKKSGRVALPAATSVR